MHPLVRAIAALIFLSTLLIAPARGGGEYQGYEAKPRITDIRFTDSAIGFIDSNRSRFVPDGPRFFVLERGATDWRQVSQQTFVNTFDSAPPVREPIKPNVSALRTSDGTTYLAVNGYCSEGVRYHGGLRFAGSWLNLHQPLCNTPSTVEHVGDALLVGTFYDGEAGNLADGAPLVVIDRRTQQLIKQTRISGIFTAIRHDTFSGKTWIANRDGLYLLDANFESEKFLRFTDQFDEKGDVVTRLNGDSKEQYIAQLARAMRVKNTAFFRNALVGHNSIRLMYGFGMGGWWPDEMLAVLEPWLIDGKVDPALYELPEVERVSLPLHSPTTTTLSGGGYSGKLENFERDNRSRSIVHARWLAWQRLGKDNYERKCIATTRTRPSPENGYFRILPNAWQLEGDWVGAELEVLIPVGADNALISPFNEILDRYGNAEPLMRIAEFLKDCPEPGFSDESLWEKELDELEAQYNARKQVLQAAKPETTIPETYDGPLLEISGTTRSIIPSTQEQGLVIVTIRYFPALDPETFRARLNTMDVTNRFNVTEADTQSVELTAPRGTSILAINAKRRGADPGEKPEIFLHKFVVESLSATQSERPDVPALIPHVAIERAVSVNAREDMNKPGRGEQ